MRVSRGISLLVAALIVWASAPAQGAEVTTVPRRPVPIALDGGQLEASCDPAAEAGTRCGFWFNSAFAVGDLNFMFTELDTWDVAADEVCAHAGASVLGDYIRYRFPDKLALADPGPTYVCRHGGHASTLYQDLADIRGETRHFLVNDCSAMVDAEGNLVPCGTGPPDKLAVIGFVRFRIAKILAGDDPRAIGTFEPEATPGRCGFRNPDPNALCLVLRTV
jgi:hypothetical protein